MCHQIAKTMKENGVGEKQILKRVKKTKLLKRVLLEMGNFWAGTKRQISKDESAELGSCLMLARERS